MGHHHHHDHVGAEAGDRRMWGAIAVNLGLTVAQVVGGIVAGSLSLIADALHNFSDAASLVIAFAARRIARRPANADMTFGYGRAEIVAALVNYTTLILLAIYLVYEAAMRFIQPSDVAGWIIVIVAGIALAVDLVTAALTYAMSKDSVNIRAAFVHNLADALGSVAVIVAGTLIILFGWWWVDPAVTLMIAGYILWIAWAEIGGVIRILMQGTPPDLDPCAAIEAMRGVEGVDSVHHAHFWQMEENRAAMEAHVVVAEGRWAEADAIKARLKTLLAEKFDVPHSTLELECARHACDDPQVIGHG